MVTSFKDLKAYSGEFIALITWTPMHFIILFFIWTIIYSSNTNVSENFGYTLNSILAYSLIITLISEGIASYKISWALESDNLNGTLTNYLCRPVDYMTFKFFEMMPAVFIRTILALPVVLFIAWIMNLPIILSFSNIVGFIILIIIGYLINYILNFLIGMSTFKIRYIWPFRSLYISITQIIGGDLIPIDILPKFIQEIALILPFKYISFEPAQLLLGRSDWNRLIENVIFGSIWIIVLLVFVRYLWHREVRNFEGVGG